MGQMQANWVLTNDDGLGAPGLEALFRWTEGLGERVGVAPSRAHSCGSHAVTLDRELVIERWDEDRLTIDGTPADCVRLALHHLVQKPELVISGINAGGNLGTDQHHSGTVAAVREGVLHGVPGVAISQYVARGFVVDWDLAGRWSRRVIEQLLEWRWVDGTFWSVNLPHLAPGSAEPRIVRCRPDPSPLPLKYRIVGNRVRYEGDYHGRRRIAGSDVEVCFGGDIAVCQIRVQPDSTGEEDGREG